MELMKNGWTTNALLITIILILWAYLKIKSIYTFFEKRNIAYVKPTFLLGSDIKGALLQDNIGMAFHRIYKKLKNEKVGGCFLGVVPLYMIRDPGFVNKIFSSNFESFHDRPFLIDEETNPLEGHLFFLKGKKWKSLRNKLSPIFTSGKLKYMYDEMIKCSKCLADYLGSLADGRDINLQEIIAQFTTDVIGSTAFGLEPHNLNNSESQFRAMGRKFFEPSFRNAITFFLRFACPQLVIYFKIRTTEKVISDYFLSLFKQVFDHRIKTGQTRTDIVQLSLQLKAKGFIEINQDDLEENERIEMHNEKYIEKIEITDQLLAAQSFVFFVAGFETTANTMNYFIYMMSIHKDIQEKVRKEVRETKKKYGSITYDSLKELTYLDKCLEETQRLFPVVPMINRMCTKDYTFPDGTTIEKGTQVVIPLFSLHRDPAYFPDPEKFIPERFDKSPIRGTYAPFGDGPRICIGKRFAQVEMKMTLSMLLDQYIFEKSPLTITPLKFGASLTLQPENPLYVRIKNCQ